MKKSAQIFSVLAVVITLYMLTSAIFAQASSTKGEATSVSDAEKPKFTADGELIPFSADVYREWVFVGTPITPNDLNDGEAAFPEFHNVYMNPSAWRELKKSGRYPEGTVMVKELVSVGAKRATSGNGYFEGEFTGLEMSVKDSKRFPAEAKGWGYFSFGHKYPLKNQAPPNMFTSCAQCHAANAASDMVFSQYYPPLRAAKGK
jgi:cytochrome c553